MIASVWILFIDNACRFILAEFFVGTPATSCLRDRDTCFLFNSMATRRATPPHPPPRALSSSMRSPILIFEHAISHSDKSLHCSVDCASYASGVDVTPLHPSHSPVERIKSSAGVSGIVPAMLLDGDCNNRSADQVVVVAGDIAEYC